MKNLASHLNATAIVLWVGSLWAIGLIAAPTLFSVLKENTQLAGLLAGKMFTLTAYIGMACALYVLIYRLATEGTGAFKQWFFWIALAMLGLILIGHFGVQPIIQRLKVEGGAAEVMQSVVANRFAHWHGIASILYVVQSLLGLTLVLKQR